MVFRAVDRPVAGESECQRRLDTRAGPGMAELYYYVEATHGVGLQPGGGKENGRGVLLSGCASRAMLRSGGRAARE